MSTRNIPQLPQIKGSLKATAGHVRDRSRAVSVDLSSLDRDEDEVRIGAAAVLQSIEDERAPLREEADQLISILEAARGSVPQVVEQAPPAPAQPDVATPPAEPPAPPEPAQVDEPEPPVQTAVLEEQPTPAPQGSEELGLGREVEVPQRSHWFDPRGWSWLQWLLAILLGFVGLFIGLRTVNWATSDWNVGWPEGLVVFLAVVFGFLWVAVFTAVGFFGGALLGNSIPRRIEHRRNRGNNPAAPVPPIPAVPPANPPAS